MKQVVLKLDVHDDRDKQRALKRVTGISGVDSVSMDMKEKKLTVVGDVDPVKIASRLRKLYAAEIVSVGEPKKPEEKKKEEPAKKPDADGGKDKKAPEQVAVVPPPYYYSHQPYYSNHRYGYGYGNGNYSSYGHYGSAAQVVGDDPNACVIC